MNQILELREKRAKAWDAAKAFLDSRRGADGLISTEDATCYDKMEVDIVSLGKEIDRLERQQTLDLELSRPVNTPIKNQPSASGAESRTGRASDEYKRAFWQAMRSKNHFDVRNALQVGTDSEGGYLVPDEFEATLIQALEEQNVFRRIANVINTSSGDRKIPVVASNGTASWIDEEGPISDSDDAFSQVTIGAFKLATMIKVSEELLNDNVFNLERYIAREFGRRMGAKEEEAFFIGDGSGKPTGIFNSTGGAQVGVTSAAAAAITMDEIIDLYHSLKSPYRQNAVWIMNDATVKAIRKLKDGSGQYMWQPALPDGAPNTIMGRPVITSNVVPTMASTKKVIAFGDFSYYWLADRQGRSFQRLNELYAANGQVGFRATQRVDGKLVLPEAIQVLQMKA